MIAAVLSPGPSGWRKHLLLISLVAVVVAVVYARVTGAWFCGFDDFNEGHRAAFEDSRNPAGILTSTHFVGYMYRPVTSGLQYLTWNLFKHSPLAFRLRNLAMHLVCAAAVYGIVWLIVGSSAIAAGAALLFGLDPIENETVAVAIWTNATAYALTFGAFFFFLVSLRLQRDSRRWILPLLGSLACALTALFAYEPTAVVFGLIVAYLAVWRMRGSPLLHSYLTILLVGVGIEVVAFFGVRHLMITESAPWNSSGTILRNAAMYLFALLSPIDVVLANALFGTPLPSQVHFEPRLLALPALLVAALAVLAVIVARNRSIRDRVANVDRLTVLFLLLAIVLGVLPLLLYHDHPSEHDLYLSVAFYSALVAIVAWELAHSRVVYGIIILLLALSFTSGTLVRNERVVKCATIAQRIVTQLPVGHWRTGSRHIFLATAPGERLGMPYALYNYSGLLTLQTEKPAFPSAQEALQIASGNERLRVDVVGQFDIIEECRHIETCFWVTASGSVTDAVLTSGEKVAQ